MQINKSDTYQSYSDSSVQVIAFSSEDVMRCSSDTKLFNRMKCQAYCIHNSMDTESDKLLTLKSPDSPSIMGSPSS